MKTVQSHLQLADFENNQLEWTISEPLFNVWHPIIDIFSRGRYGILINHVSICKNLNEYV
jgi:hypothetical protein